MAQECQYPELLFEELYGPGLGEGGDKHPAARHSDNPVDTIGSCWYWKSLLECVCDFFSRKCKYCWDKVRSRGEIAEEI